MEFKMFGTKNRRPNIRTKTKVDASKSSLFSFMYISPGATNPQPLVMCLRRKGKGGTRKFKYNGSKTRTEDYIAGIVLNHISPTVRAYIIKKFQKRTYITYQEIKIVGKFTKYLYRVYYWRHIRNIKQIDATRYVNNILGKFE